MSDTPRIVDALATSETWLPPLPVTLSELPPLSGTVPLDPITAQLHGPSDVDFDDPSERRAFTTTLVGAAPPSAITAYLTADQLRDDWPHLALVAPIRHRWEAAFPSLRRGRS